MSEEKDVKKVSIAIVWSRIRKKTIQCMPTSNQKVSKIYSIQKDKMKPSLNMDRISEAICLKRGLPFTEQNCVIGCMNMPSIKQMKSHESQEVKNASQC